MQLDKYELEISATKHTFHFISQGQRHILKRIEYALVSKPTDYGLPDDVELYNLGFGDVIFSSETGEKIVSDSERSNNGDKLKVLNTLQIRCYSFLKIIQIHLFMLKGVLNLAIENTELGLIKSMKR